MPQNVPISPEKHPVKRSQNPGKMLRRLVELVGIEPTHRSQRWRLPSYLLYLSRLSSRVRSNSNRLAWSCLTTSLRGRRKTSFPERRYHEHWAPDRQPARRQPRLTWDQLFDPCTNMRVGTHLLMAYHKQAATFASKFPFSSFRNGVLSVYPPYSWSESHCGHRHVLSSLLQGTPFRADSSSDARCPVARSFQSSTNSTNGPTTAPGPTVVSAQNSPCPAPGAAEPCPH